MLLVIFPMFAFPKKLPPRHKKKKRRKKLSLEDMSSEDDVLKEKSSNKSQTVSSSMGFGKDIKGQLEPLGGVFLTGRSLLFLPRRRPPHLSFSPVLLTCPPLSPRPAQGCGEDPQQHHLPLRQPLLHG